MIKAGKINKRDIMPLPEENKRLAVRWHDATLPPLSKTHALLVFQWGFFIFDQHTDMDSMGVFLTTGEKIKWNKDNGCVYKL